MSTDNNFPLIYCNGDSYSVEFSQQGEKINTYADVVAQECTGFVLNKAIAGSCNRRIIRTTVHDIIQQRQLNPTQKIVALIGLSFDLRSELWIDNIENDRPPEESNFRTHTFSSQIDWRENLLNGKDIQSVNRNKQEDDFFKKFSQGRAYFYSPYAERINLFCDLTMLTHVLDRLNVNFIIFRSPTEENLKGSDYLLDFFKTQLASNTGIIDLDSFSFCNWAYKKKFTPLDFFDRPEIAHYGSDAHSEFAKQILIPKLKEQKIL